MAFPDNGIIDAFGRADGGLGTSWSGPSFGDANNLTIVSNTITSAANAFGSQLYNGLVVGKSYEVFCTIPTLPLATKTSRIISFNALTGGVGNGYYIVINPTLSTFQLADASDGSNIGTTITQAFSAGDSGGFSRDVTGLITIWYKSGAGLWTPIGTRMDNRYPGPFYLGLELEDNIQRISNFGGGSLSGILTPNSGYWGGV